MLGRRPYRRTLDFTGGRFINPGGNALNVDRVTVEQALFCRDSFVADGAVCLARAQVGGWLDLSGASLSNHNGTALGLQAASIEELILRPAHPPDGMVDLTNAKTSIFHDDYKTWPSTLGLRGFTYDILENDQISVHDRLRWLTRHAGGYTPQIYDQLAAAYKRSGNDPAARRVGVTKQWRRHSIFNPFNWLMYATVGYGYRTWLAAVWLTSLALLGSSLFAIAHDHHLIRATPDAPAFHPVAYTLDLLLPVLESRTAHGIHPPKLGALLVVGVNRLRLGADYRRRRRPHRYPKTRLTPLVHKSD